MCLQKREAVRITMVLGITCAKIGWISMVSGLESTSKKKHEVVFIPSGMMHQTLSSDLTISVRYQLLPFSFDEIVRAINFTEMWQNGPHQFIYPETPHLDSCWEKPF